MNISTLCFALSALAVDYTPPADLFSKLDKNSDGRITRDELNHSQQAMFQRALRVADKNEDSALTSEEFSRAISDPKPVELPGTNAAARMGSFDIKALDKNSDGNISLDEIPAPMKDRFQQLLDQVGQESIPVDRVQAYLRGERPPEADPGKPDMKEMPKIQPDKPAGRKDEKGSAKGNPVSRAVFNQLDGNADGKLTGDEVPRRLQENVKAADSDKDGSISPTEFEAVLKRRMQKQK